MCTAYYENVCQARLSKLGRVYIYLWRSSTLSCRLVGHRSCRTVCVWERIAAERGRTTRNPAREHTPPGLTTCNIATGVIEHMHSSSTRYSSCLQNQPHQCRFTTTSTLGSKLRRFHVITMFSLATNTGSRLQRAVSFTSFHSVVSGISVYQTHWHQRMNSRSIQALNCKLSTWSVLHFFIRVCTLRLLSCVLAGHGLTSKHHGSAMTSQK